MKITNKQRLQKLQSVKQSITAHPDCEQGTEFADMVDQLLEVMNSIRLEMLQEVTIKLNNFSEEQLKSTPMGKALVSEKILLMENLKTFETTQEAPPNTNASTKIVKVAAYLALDTADYDEELEIEVPFNCSSEKMQELIEEAMSDWRGNYFESSYKILGL